MKGASRLGRDLETIVVCSAAGTKADPYGMTTSDKDRSLRDEEQEKSIDANRMWRM